MQAQQSKMNNISDNELADLCKSNNLSLDALQEIINTLGPRISSQNQLCFHEACYKNKNVTLEIVQLLHNTLPGALRLRDDNGWLPIHFLCCNDDLDEAASLDILRFMLEIDPTLPSETTDSGNLPIHLAVKLKSARFCKELIENVLHNTLPEAFRLRNDYGSLPIHCLCDSGDLDDTASLDILRFMLSIDPTLSREVGNDWLPVHYAFKYKSTAFCKELIDAYLESLRVASYDGVLPIHRACCDGKRDDTNDTIQYMLELDPELINAEDSEGNLPIHYAADHARTKLIELLLKYDPDAASKEVNNGSRRLPLHLACNYPIPIQVLYDAYPEAILISDEDGDTPLDLARNQPTKNFLQTQLVYARQAQDMTAITTVDETGQLPLHRALKNNAPLGSIKLLTRANPAAVQVSDQNGAHPLHIACKLSSVKVVKFLVELDGDTLNNVDANDDSPLHYACRRGNLGIVKYLLQANAPSISDRNNDNKLAIHLLFECGSVILDQDSLEYVETIQQLLLANPEVVRDFMS